MSANDVVGTLTRGLKEFHLDDSELDDRTVIGESELVRRYDEINAKTMYNMMEEIGDQRLFFLTNQQADLLAESEASIDRLIKALELPKEPKLVIILQPDQGFTNLVSCWECDKNWGAYHGLAWLTAARKEEADRQGVDAKGGEKEKAAFSGEDRGPVGLTKGAARGAGAARARQRV